MLASILTLFVALQAPQAAKLDDIKPTLMRAESLYYEARFADAVQLLVQLNDDLQDKPDRMPDRINVKLQLGLAQIGMNNAPVAKLFLMEIFILQPDFVLDTKQYSPKVLVIVDEARAEAGRVRCQRAGKDARKGIASNDAPAVLNLLRTMKPRCADLATFEPETAELVYRNGLRDYKAGDLFKAAENFRTTLQLAPKHEMAAQYLDLAEGKLRAEKDRVAMEADYHKAMGSVADAWKRACASGDATRMNEIRGEVRELLPACAVPVSEPRVVQVANVVSSELPAPVRQQKQSCFEMASTAALARLKFRVEPEFSREVRGFFQNQKLMIRVKATIDEAGNVTVSEVLGSNPPVQAAVRTAVEKWKFLPAMDQSGVSRCVNTEIQFSLGN